MSGKKGLSKPKMMQPKEYGLEIIDENVSYVLLLSKQWQRKC
jgi:hypothetical protein